MSQLQALVEDFFAGALPTDVAARSAAGSLGDDAVRPALAAALLLLVDHGILDPAGGPPRPAPGAARPSSASGNTHTGGVAVITAPPGVRVQASGRVTAARPTSATPASPKRDAVSAWWSAVLETDVVVAPRASMKLGRMTPADLQQAAGTHRGTAAHLTQRADRLDVLARALTQHRAATVAQLPPQVLREQLAAFAPQLAPAPATPPAT